MIQSNSVTSGIEENPKCNFTYNGHSYSFDIRFSISKSNLIWNNLDQIKTKLKIDLFENENIELDEEIINDFISYLNNESNQLTITDNNVFTLNELSKTFQTPLLQKNIDKYINEHQNELLPKLLNHSQLTANDEKIISHHLIEYISNKQLSSLQPEVISRILANYRKENKNNLEDERKVTDFIIKLFLKNQRNLSFLFQYIDYENDIIFQEFLNSILASKIFDVVNFQFFPNDFLKKIILLNRKDQLQNMKSTTQTIKSEKEIMLEIEQSLRKKETKVIEVPNGITTISKGAFNNTDIEEVILPESLISIEDETFAYCTKLRKVTIKSNKLVKIGNYAFHDTANLENIILPDSVSNIGQSAFSGCGLVSMNMPDNMRTIQQRTFFECTKLQYVENMQNITKIEEFAFYRCHALKHIDIKNVIDIENRAFCHCNKLEKIDLPVVRHIGEYAFYDTSLSEDSHIRPLADLGKEAFGNNPNIKRY